MSLRDFERWALSLSTQDFKRFCFDSANVQDGAKAAYQSATERALRIVREECNINSEPAYSVMPEIERRLKGDDNG